MLVGVVPPGPLVWAQAQDQLLPPSSLLICQLKESDFPWGSLLGFLPLKVPVGRWQSALHADQQMMVLDQGGMAEAQQDMRIQPRMSLVLVHIGRAMAVHPR